MKRIFLLLSFSFLLLFSCSNEPKSPYAVIKTDMGDIKIRLFESVPGHTNNFIKLTKEGFYDGLLFHRVVNGFMIQGGDPASRDAAPGIPLGNGGPGYQVPAEIRNYHFRGTLSAARTPDRVNPERQSSGSQFFIVSGSPVTDEMLNTMERNLNIKYTQAERDLYTKIGGYPSLDTQYTAYGEVTEGMDVVDKIVSVPAAPQSQGSRPFEDIKMNKVYIVYE